MMETASDLLSASPLYQTAVLDFWKDYHEKTALMEGLQLSVQAHPALQFGNHYWRSISENGIEFSTPNAGINHFNDVIAWSRIFNGTEVLCAINLHPHKQAVVYVTIDEHLHGTGSKMKLLYGSGSVPEELNVEDRNGKSIRLTLPTRALVIYG
ncbi:MAG: alpha amylase C-terminal domain-containing protein [Dyadobacter sp.]|uniref:alpha amylase C-terminal domain-containing protein n=1 Tax=Dyadobacter sp. TaxID=1914288 RepID=UPI0032640EED